MSERRQRKLDHVRLAAEQRLDPAEAGLPAPGWADVHLVHRSLPERNLDEVDLRTSIAGVRMARPVIINAMTGGAPEVEPINRALAEVARDLNLAMAVGSQTAGLKEEGLEASYRTVREVNPEGVIVANLSASATTDEALRAVAMVRADLLQIHLNAPQELVMAEGDRHFRGQLERIGELVTSVPVPVLVKECGFGLSRESAAQLYGVGVRAMDVSGRGGTNFAWIEARRSGRRDLDPGLEAWGIPTACTLAEVAALELPGLDIVASGGIAHGTEAAKALALGAKAVGVAGAVLRRHQSDGPAGVREYLTTLLEDVKRAALLCGAATVRDLWHQPVVITGETGQWCHLRGVDLMRLARRS